MRTSVERSMGHPRRPEYGLTQPRPSKLTPEMCKAIRRQEFGIDYWKTGFPGYTNLVSNPAEKKPTYSRVTQINLDFPGAFFPNLGGGSQRTKQNNKVRPTIVFHRSRSSLIPSIPPDKTAAVPSLQNSKRASVTDINCLQLADTLFGTRRTSVEGFLNVPQSKSRYSDFLLDEAVGENGDPDCERNENLSTRFNNKIIMPSRGRPSVALKYQTIQANSPDDDVPDPTGGLNEEKRVTKPHKSILKNRNQKSPSVDNDSDSDSSDRSSTTTFHLVPLKPDKHLYDSVSLDSVRPKMKRVVGRAIINDLPRNRNVDFNLAGIVQDMDLKKRTVRFNVSNEIREFTPCDPIYHC